MKNLPKIAKAIVAFLAPTITSVVAALQQSLTTHTAVDWHVTALTAPAAFLTSLIVWAVPNGPTA